MSTNKAKAHRTSSASPVDGAASWLTETVLDRLNDSEKFFYDLATELPFSSVVRGRFPIPATDILARAKTVIESVRGKAKNDADDLRCATITARVNLFNLLQSIESKTNNLSFLIRRTRFFVAAQLEKLITPPAAE